MNSWQLLEHCFAFFDRQGNGIANPSSNFFEGELGVASLRGYTLYLNTGLEVLGTLDKSLSRDNTPPRAGNLLAG